MPKHLYDCTVSYHTMNINVGNIGQLTIDSNMDCIPDWPNNQNRNLPVTSIEASIAEESWNELLIYNLEH